MGYNIPSAKQTVCALLNQGHIRLKEETESGKIYAPTHKLAQYVKEKRLMD